MRRTIHRGMTLVELLVVVTIIGILGGIVALVAPRFQEQSRVAEGSRQFTNWLNIARLRAQRDKAPRGLRLVEYLSSSVPQKKEYYYKFAYVEQPEDITGDSGPEFTNGATTQTQLSNNRKAMQTAIGPQLPAPFSTLVNENSTTPVGWKYLLPLQSRNLIGVVKAGDVIEFGSCRYQLVVDPLPYAPLPNGCVLVFNRPRDECRVSLTVAQTSRLPSYRIIRSARPIAGEPQLTLPTNVALDFVYPSNTTGPGFGGPISQNSSTPTRSYPVPSSGGQGFFDVMFSPAGEVIGGVGASGRVIFWIRDVSLDDPGLGLMPPGENRLVVLHCRNGQVTAHPVNPTVSTTGTLTDPYSFVRDGKSSAAENE